MASLSGTVKGLQGTTATKRRSRYPGVRCKYVCVE